jgi:hypothetical protein
LRKNRKTCCCLIRFLILLSFRLSGSNYLVLRLRRAFSKTFFTSIASFHVQRARERTLRLWASKQKEGERNTRKSFNSNTHATKRAARVKNSGIALRCCVVTRQFHLDRSSARSKRKSKNYHSVKNSFKRFSQPVQERHDKNQKNVIFTANKTIIKKKARGVEKSYKKKIEVESRR